MPDFPSLPGSCPAVSPEIRQKLFSLIEPLGVRIPKGSLALGRNQPFEVRHPWAESQCFRHARGKLSFPSSQKRKKFLPHPGDAPPPATREGWEEILKKYSGGDKRILWRQLSEPFELGPAYGRSKGESAGGKPVFSARSRDLGDPVFAGGRLSQEQPNRRCRRRIFLSPENSQGLAL